MQQQQHKTVSKSTTAKEHLASVWELTRGKFDDGIVAIHPVVGAKPEKRGPSLRSLMKLHELNDDDLDKNFCRQCGKEHPHRRRFCDACKQKRVEDGKSVSW